MPMARWYGLSITQQRILKRQERKKNKVIPGWNIYCKEKYKMTRIPFLAWLSHGKIRNGVLFENIKTTRKIFVIASKYCKRNENVIRNNILAESVRSKTGSVFRWKLYKESYCNFTEDV